MKIKDLLIYGTNLKVVDSTGIVMDVEGYDFNTNSVICERVSYKLSEVTPILKKLGDISKKDLDHIGTEYILDDGCSGKVLWRDKFDEFSPFVLEWPHKDINYLASKGYVVFNFIESGHAIDPDSNKITH